MRFGYKNILRLSGKIPDKPLEKKSENLEAAVIFRRFFYALEQLDLKARFKLGRPTHDQENKP
jgi:hypothetical protein